jgi:hypothetical protein
MLKDEIKKKTQKYSSQSGLTCQTRDLNHEIMIT